MTSQGQRFRRRALRRGYKVDEVDAFLDRVEATLAGDPIGAPVAAQEVHDVVFRVRFGGYDEWQVDLHLDRVERQLAELEERGGAARPRRRMPGPDGRRTGCAAADARRPDGPAGRCRRRRCRAPAARADGRDAARRSLRRPTRSAGAWPPCATPADAARRPRGRAVRGDRHAAAAAAGPMAAADGRAGVRRPLRRARRTAGGYGTRRRLRPAAHGRASTASRPAGTAAPT